VKSVQIWEKNHGTIKYAISTYSLEPVSQSGRQAVTNFFNERDRLAGPVPHPWTNKTEKSKKRKKEKSLPKYGFYSIFYRDEKFFPQEIIPQY
jgi:hypothetical protein